LIKGLIIMDLKVISNDKGAVYHGMRHTDAGFSTFEEIYFSLIKQNALKAWKMHNKMTLNLVVPVGEVRFNFIELDENDAIKDRVEINVGDTNYCRVTVPPKIIFGFKGLSNNTNLVSNISNLVHDDQECTIFPEDKFQFK